MVLCGRIACHAGDKVIAARIDIHTNGMIK